MRKVETVLLSSGQFSLPFRQQVRQNTSLEVVVIDLTKELAHTQGICIVVLESGGFFRIALEADKNDLRSGLI